MWILFLEFGKRKTIFWHFHASFVWFMLYSVYECMEKMVCFRIPRCSKPNVITPLPTPLAPAVLPAAAAGYQLLNQNKHLPETKVEQWYPEYCWMGYKVWYLSAYVCHLNHHLCWFNHLGVKKHHVCLVNPVEPRGSRWCCSKLRRPMLGRKRQALVWIPYGPMVKWLAGESLIWMMVYDGSWWCIMVYNGLYLKWFIMVHSWENYLSIEGYALPRLNRRVSPPFLGCFN